MLSIVARALSSESKDSVIDRLVVRGFDAPKLKIVHARGQVVDRTGLLRTTLTGV